jgi:RecA-family ATPase
VTHNLPDLKTAARLLGGEINGDQILAPGPGHSTADRSLSVRIDRNAPHGFVVHSFAGDDPIACRDHVREKLKLPAFKPNGGSRFSDNDIISAVMAAVMAQGRDSKPKGKIVETYNYTDADGTLRYQVLRLEPKSFRQRRPDGNGGWIWKLEDQRVLYRLPDLKKFPDATMFVCEGEKDADRVASLGHCATTVAAGKWTQECVEALAGRDVVILQDNDDAGAKKALAAAQALHGVPKTIRIVLLPDLPDGGDVSDWLDSDPRRADKFVDICFDAPLWTAEAKQGETNTQAETESDQSETESDTEPPLPFIDMSHWDERPAPPRQWAVHNRVPMRQPTLLSGEGAVGKSILELQLCVAHVLGRDWIGSMPEPGPAIYIGAEDDTDELHRRLEVIATYYGAKFADLINGGLHLLSFADSEMLLGVPDRHSRIIPTPLFNQLLETAANIKPKHIGIDTSADAFSGNEIDRTQVRQFIAMLRKLAIAADGSVVLLSHPSLTGINSGSGLSGSTAWHNSVRARMYLKSPEPEEGEQPDSDLRELVCKKNNYGPVSESIVVRYREGLFVLENNRSALDQLAHERRVDDAFLSVLKKLNEQNRPCSPNKHAGNFAPAVINKHPDGKAFSKKELEAAMERLINANTIHIENVGPPSKQKQELVLGPAFTDIDRGADH